MPKLKCSFHPDKAAVSSCHECGQYICDEDQRTSIDRENRDQRGHRHRTRRTYCLPCFADMYIGKVRSGRFVAIPMLILGAASGAAGVAIPSGGFFPGLAVVGLGFGVFLFLFGARKAADLKTEKREFLERAQT